MTMYSPVFEGYEEKRDSLRTWFRKHYVQEFGLKPGTLLDLGCGNGFWDGLFAEQGFTVTGLDIEPVYIAEAKAKYPGCDFAVADVRDPLLLKRYANIRYPVLLGTFETVFIRTISAFYQPDLTDAETIIRNGLQHAKPATLRGAMLLSFYTDGSGKARPGLVSGTLVHHPTKVYDDLVEQAGGKILRTTDVGRYHQVLAA